MRNKRNKTINIRRKFTIMPIIIFLLVLFIINNISKTTKNVNANEVNNNQINKDNLYILKTTVMCVNKTSDTVTVLTDDGNVYQFYGIEDWQINDKCILVMDNNGTNNNAKDDIIVKTIYTK